MTPFASGCAALIARSGTDLTCLQTKEEIHAQLGVPSTAGVEEGRYFEEYRTRRKIAQPMKYFGPGYAMGIVLTCGVSELICVPTELYLVCHRGLLGQTVRVTYDVADTVYNVELNGNSLYLFGPSPNHGPTLDDTRPAPAIPE